MEIPGFTTLDHTFAVPLDHATPKGRTISVYAREVRLADRRDRPWLVLLQGGPGHKSPRPTDTGGWLGRALREFTVLLLDQRGTGRSTPANRQTLTRLGSAAEQAEYLSHFRADAIVADRELIRRQLLGDGGRWSLLGQSYGGFCATTYLSFAPEGLDRVLITGGLPGLRATADDVYRLTYQRVLERNAEYYRRYPEDVAAFGAIRDHLAATEVRLPRGDILRPERLQALGSEFGRVGGYRGVHYLAEEAWAAPGELSDTFLIQVEELTSFATAPLYAVLHEPLYCQGTASNWSAARVLAEFPGLHAGSTRFPFTGEMIYPWMFDEYASLRPLRDAAHQLADRTGWPALYDLDVLRANEVPVAAAVYHDDLYVPREFSIETARLIRGVRPWITNEYEHDGLRRDGARIVDRLLELAY
jgi:pimeloyl-ACP methyl ester carboxylesterase